MIRENIEKFKERTGAERLYARNNRKIYMDRMGYHCPYCGCKTVTLTAGETGQALCYTCGEQFDILEEGDKPFHFVEGLDLFYASDGLKDGGDFVSVNKWKGADPDYIYDYATEARTEKAEKLSIFHGYYKPHINSNGGVTYKKIRTNSVIFQLGGTPKITRQYKYYSKSRFENLTCGLPEGFSLDNEFTSEDMSALFRAVMFHTGISQKIDPDNYESIFSSLSGMEPEIILSLIIALIRYPNLVLGYDNQSGLYAFNGLFSPEMIYSKEFLKKNPPVLLTPVEYTETMVKSLNIKSLIKASGFSKGGAEAIDPQALALMYKLKLTGQNNQRRKGK